MPVKTPRVHNKDSESFSKESMTIYCHYKIGKCDRKALMMSSVQVELRLNKTESLWKRYWPPGYHSKVEKHGINFWIFAESLKNLWWIG